LYVKGPLGTPRDVGPIHEPMEQYSALVRDTLPAPISVMLVIVGWGAPPFRQYSGMPSRAHLFAIIGWDLRPAKTSFPRSPLIARPHGLIRAPVPVTPFRIGATGGKPARRAPCRRSRGHRPFPPQAPRFLDEKIKWRPSSSPTPKSVTPPFASPGSGGPRRAVAVPLGPRVYLQSFNHHRTACATAKLAR
jgi:hypothetical protein